MNELKYYCEILSHNDMMRLRKPNSIDSDKLTDEDTEETKSWYFCIFADRDTVLDRVNILHLSEVLGEFGCTLIPESFVWTDVFDNRYFGTLFSLKEESLDDTSHLANLEDGVIKLIAGVTNLTERTKVNSIEEF